MIILVPVVILAVCNGIMVAVMVILVYSGGKLLMLHGW